MARRGNPSQQLGFGNDRHSFVWRRSAWTRPGSLATHRGSGLGGHARRRRCAERHHGRAGRNGVRIRVVAAGLRHRAAALRRPGDDGSPRAGHGQGSRGAGPGAVRGALGHGLRVGHGRHQFRGLRGRVRRHRPGCRHRRHTRPVGDRRRAGHPRIDGSHHELQVVRTAGARPVAGVVQFHRARGRGPAGPRTSGLGPVTPSVRRSARLLRARGRDRRGLDHALDVVLPAVGECGQGPDPERPSRRPNRDPGRGVRQPGVDGGSRDRGRGGDAIRSRLRVPAS